MEESSGSVPCELVSISSLPIIDKTFPGIIQAAAFSNSEAAFIVEKMLQEGENVEEKGEMGISALHAAAACGNLLPPSVKEPSTNEAHSINILRLLLKHGASLDSVDNFGRNPLYYAVYFGKELMVEEIIMTMNSKSAWTTMSDSEGISIAHIAAYHGYDSVLELILDQWPELINLKSKGGLTPLHMATISGQEDCINFLITKEPILNAVTKNGNTVLHLACACNLRDAVELLIDMEVSPLISSKKLGFNPLHIAAQLGHSECLECILDYVKYSNMINDTDRGGMTILHWAALLRKTNCVQTIMGRKMLNIHQTDAAGRTPLHAAVRGGSLSITKILLEAGANPLAIDWKGRTPLFYAAASPKDKQGRVLLLILAHSSSLYYKDILGRTVLHCACVADNPQKLNLLLSQDTTKTFSSTKLVDSLDHNEQTPLHLSAYFGKEKCAQILVLNGQCNYNAKDKFGCTPLYYAIQQGHYRIADFLIQVGARITENIVGILPTAVKHSRVRAFRLLLESAVLSSSSYDISPDSFESPFSPDSDVIDSVDSLKRTAVHYACINGQKEMLLDLIRCCANVNLKDKYGKTPLHYAVINKNVQCVALLCSERVNPGVVDAAGLSPMHYAVLGSQHEIFLMLLDADFTSLQAADFNGKNIIHYIVYNNNVSFLSAVLSYKDVTGRIRSYINQKDVMERTPLYTACFVAAKECIKMLLSHKYVSMDSDKLGKTPLMVASWSGSISSIKYLLQAGADISKVDNNKRNMLHRLCFKGYYDGCSFIIKSVSRDTVTNLILQKDVFNQNCIQFAEKAKHFAIAKMFSEYLNTGYAKTTASINEKLETVEAKPKAARYAKAFDSTRETEALLLTANARSMEAHRIRSSRWQKFIQKKARESIFPCIPLPTAHESPNIAKNSNNVNNSHSYNFYVESASSPVASKSAKLLQEREALFSTRAPAESTPAVNRYRNQITIDTPQTKVSAFSFQPTPQAVPNTESIVETISIDIDDEDMNVNIDMDFSKVSGRSYSQAESEAEIKPNKPLPVVIQKPQSNNVAPQSVSEITKTPRQALTARKNTGAKLHTVASSTVHDRRKLEPSSLSRKQQSSSVTPSAKLGYTPSSKAIRTPSEKSNISISSAAKINSYVTPARSNSTVTPARSSSTALPARYSSAVTPASKSTTRVKQTAYPKGLSPNILRQKLLLEERRSASAKLDRRRLFSEEENQPNAQLTPMKMDDSLQTNLKEFIQPELDSPLRPVAFLLPED